MLFCLENANQMNVMFVRCPYTSNCSLSYGIDKDNLNEDAQAQGIRFRSGIRTIYTHLATMQNLKPDTKYCKKLFELDRKLMRI